MVDNIAVKMYLCVFLNPVNLCSVCSETETFEICILNTSDKICIFKDFNCTNCTKNNINEHNHCKLNNESILCADLKKCSSNLINNDESCFTKVCIEKCNKGIRWKCLCTIFNCTGLNVALTSSENESNNYTATTTTRPSLNCIWDDGSTQTTPTAETPTTSQEVSNINGHITTMLNSTENPSYDDSETEARGKIILIGLIVGMVLLFILLLITIVVIWRLRLRAKTREELKANPSNLAQRQNSIMTRIQPLEKYDDCNIYHQLDTTYGDSDQMPQYKTKQNSTDICCPIIGVLENGINAESATSSIAPKTSQVAESGSDTRIGGTYFILEEQDLGFRDNSIAEKVAEDSYFILEHVDINESSKPPDTSSSGDSVSSPAGYSRFGDITRKTTNEYDTFVGTIEENLGDKDKTLDHALEIIATGAQSGQTGVYEMAKTPILQEAVLNAGAEMPFGTIDSKYLKLEADQKNFADPTYFVLDRSTDDVDNTRMTTVEIKEEQTVTNYSKLRQVCPVFQHEYNTLSQNTDLADNTSSVLDND